jgi:hypothetical protein
MMTCTLADTKHMKQFIGSNQYNLEHIWVLQWLTLYAMGVDGADPHPQTTCAPLHILHGSVEVLSHNCARCILYTQVPPALPQKLGWHQAAPLPI